MFNDVIYLTNPNNVSKVDHDVTGERHTAKLIAAINGLDRLFRPSGIAIAKIKDTDYTQLDGSPAVAITLVVYVPESKDDKNS